MVAIKPRFSAERKTRHQAVKCGKPAPSMCALAVHPLADRLRHVSRYPRVYGRIHQTPKRTHALIHTITSYNTENTALTEVAYTICGTYIARSSSCDYNPITTIYTIDVSKRR